MQFHGSCPSLRISKAPSLPVPVLAGCSCSQCRVPCPARAHEHSPLKWSFKSSPPTAAAAAAQAPRLGRVAFQRAGSTSTSIRTEYQCPPPTRPWHCRALPTPLDTGNWHWRWQVTELALSARTPPVIDWIWHTKVQKPSWRCTHQGGGTDMEQTRPAAPGPGPAPSIHTSSDSTLPLVLLALPLP